MKITVLMTVHNGERHLGDAIDSVLRQTCADFEFLIINDASTDHTGAILRTYRDPRIRVIENEQNLGLTRSLNRGLQLATGTFVARHDADDLAEPERFATQLAFLETHPDVALVGTWYREIDDQGSVIAARTLPLAWPRIRWDLLSYNTFIHASVMFRRSLVLEQVGLYNESYAYAQDYDLWCRIADRFPVANIDEYLVRYRLSQSSMTATYGRVVTDEPLTIRAAYATRLISNPKSRQLGNRRNAPALAPAPLIERARRRSWPCSSTRQHGVVSPERLALWDQFLFCADSELPALDPREVCRAIDAMLPVYASFVELGTREQATYAIYARDVRATTSRRLVDVATCCTALRKRGAAPLLMKAARIHAAILATKSYHNAALKLLGCCASPGNGLLR